MCPKNHILKGSKLYKSAFCDCGDPLQSFNCLIASPKNVLSPQNYCTYNISGNEMIKQHLFDVQHAQ
jgi:hypothetical protein